MPLRSTVASGTRIGGASNRRRSQLEQVAQLLLGAQQHVFAARTVARRAPRRDESVDLTARAAGRGPRVAGTTRRADRRRRPRGGAAARFRRRRESRSLARGTASCGRSRTRAAETTAPTAPDMPAAGRPRRATTDEHEEERDVRVRDRVANADERTGDEDRPIAPIASAHRVDELSSAYPPLYLSTGPRRLPVAPSAPLPPGDFAACRGRG